MAEESDLRNQIDEQRDQISHTVDEIEGRISTTVNRVEDRVRPSRIARRKRNQFRARFDGWKERVMGSDSEDQYVSHLGTQSPSSPEPDARQPGMRDRIAETSHGAQEQLHGMQERLHEHGEALGEKLSDAPEQMRQRTRGNPVAPGLIAFGAGLLLASMLPESQREQRAARKIQPELEEATGELAESGREVAGDMRESARQAASAVSDTASEAASDTMEEGKRAASRH